MDGIAAAAWRAYINPIVGRSVRRAGLRVEKTGIVGIDGTVWGWGERRVYMYLLHVRLGKLRFPTTPDEAGEAITDVRKGW